MPIEFRKRKIYFTGIVDIEEAEGLINHLQGKSGLTAVFSECEHIHPANLQVLMAAGVKVTAWPKDEALSNFLKSGLLAND